MKLAVISDTHFGDPHNLLVEPSGNGFEPGSRFEDFKEAAGKGNDYLVLLGDIFDFSVESYEKVFRAARIFFREVKKENIANEIIYVPGNHDFDMWHTVEYQTRIIMRIESGELPDPFRLSVPAVIDGRKKPLGKHRLSLHGVTAKRGSYGGLFLDSIVGTSPDEKIVVNVAYPNIYLVSDDGTVMLTHGQYFEPYWSLAGEWLMKVAQDDLQLGDAVDVRELVGLNHPLSQLACSGIGQAGPLTPLVQVLEHEIKRRDLHRLRTYLDRLDNEIDRVTDYPWHKQYMELLTDAISNKTKKLIFELLENSRPTRFDKKKPHTPDFSQRFWSFFKAALCEIDDINQTGNSVPIPRWVVFGHTHCPIPWADPQAPRMQPQGITGMNPIRLYNTGGWINRETNDGRKEFCGAEVFLFDSDVGFTSVGVG